MLDQLDAKRASRTHAAIRLRLVRRCAAPLGRARSHPAVPRTFQGRHVLPAEDVDPSRDLHSSGWGDSSRKAARCPSASVFRYSAPKFAGGVGVDHPQIVCLVSKHLAVLGQHPAI